jgi:hypothetical protein
VANPNHSSLQIQSQKCELFVFSVDLMMWRDWWTYFSPLWLIQSQLATDSITKTWAVGTFSRSHDRKRSIDVHLFSVVVDPITDRGRWDPKKVSCFGFCVGSPVRRCQSTPRALETCGWHTFQCPRKNVSLNDVEWNLCPTSMKSRWLRSSLTSSSARPNGRTGRCIQHERNKEKRRHEW